MKIGIDMTWLKPCKSGGVESYIRNLLDGFVILKNDNEYILFCAKDNIDSLKLYKNDSRFSIVECNTLANDVKGHLLWQNTKEKSVLRKYNLDLLFNPVYEMPLTKIRNMKVVTGIMDIQAFHYPEYFSKLENVWFKLGWQKAIDNSDLVLTISDYTKNDIKKNMKRTDNVERIYIPVVLNDENKIKFSGLSKEFNIKKNEYYYTVCSLHKHKNLSTLISVMEKLKNNKINLPTKLVVSGVGGPNKASLINEIEEKGLKDNIILTRFVSNEERNCLIKNSNIFLFPSIFEGFGMPPIEAMMLGSRVLSTKETSLQEVTDNKCSYVLKPFDVKEWINKIKDLQNVKPKKINFPQYDKEKIASEYLVRFEKLLSEDK